MEAEQRGTRTAEMGWGGRERDWADAQLGHSSRSWRWPSAGSLLRVSHQDSCAVAVLWIAHHRCATITAGLLLGNTVSRHAAVVGDSLPSEKLAVSTHTLPRFMTNRKQANQRCSFSLLDVGMLMLESPLQVLPFVLPRTWLLYLQIQGLSKSGKFSITQFLNLLKTIPAVKHFSYTYIEVGLSAATVRHQGEVASTVASEE